MKAISESTASDETPAASPELGILRHDPHKGVCVWGDKSWTLFVLFTEGHVGGSAAWDYVHTKPTKSEVSVHPAAVLGHYT